MLAFRGRARFSKQRLSKFGDSFRLQARGPESEPMRTSYGSVQCRSYAEAFALSGGRGTGIQLLHRWDPESYAKFCSGLAIPHHWAVSLCPDGQEGEMAESSAKQDRADRKLAKYISRRSLAIGIALLAVVFVTAIIYGAG